MKTTTNEPTTQEPTTNPNLHTKTLVFKKIADDQELEQLQQALTNHQVFGNFRRKKRQSSNSFPADLINSIEQTLSVYEDMTLIDVSVISVERDTFVIF